VPARARREIVLCDDVRVRKAPYSERTPAEERACTAGRIGSSAYSVGRGDCLFQNPILTTRPLSVALQPEQSISRSGYVRYLILCWQMTPLLPDQTSPTTASDACSRHIRVSRSRHQRDGGVERGPRSSCGGLCLFASTSPGLESGYPIPTWNSANSSVHIQLSRPVQLTGHLKLDCRGIFRDKPNAKVSQNCNFPSSTFFRHVNHVAAPHVHFSFAMLQQRTRRVTFSIIRPFLARQDARLRVSSNCLTAKAR
jgi:hypothetical protein